MDYGYGNIRSVARALTKAGVSPVISGDPRELVDADAAVVPGVGAADSAMKSLERLGLVSALREFIATGRPIAGGVPGAAVVDGLDGGGGRAVSGGRCGDGEASSIGSEGAAHGLE